MLKIDEVVKAEIETATGRPVPDPQSRRFEAFFESLTHDHPDLARKLEDALEVTTPYPDEEAQRAARRRARIDGLVRRMFTKEVWGQRVLDRRRISFVVFFVVFGVVAAGWSVTLMRGREGRTVQSASVPVAAEEVRPVPVEMEVDLEPAPTLVAQVASLPPRSEKSSGSSLPPQELPPYPGSIPPAPTGAYVPPGSYSTDAPPAAMVVSLPLGEVSAVEAPALAFSEEIIGPSGESLGLPAPLEATSPTSALAESIAGNESELAPALATRQVDGGGWRARAPITLAVAPADRRTVPAFLPASAALSDTVETVGDPLRPGTGTPVAATPAGTPLSDTAGVPTLMVQETQDARSDLEDRITAPRDDDALRPGLLFPATLLRDVVVPEGEAGRVVADGTEDWCGRATCPALRWLGTATLAESGRLSVDFDRAYVDGELVEVDAVAFGSDGAEGLAAALADIAPALLADLVRAGAGGVSDYVDAAAEAGTVVVGRDTITTETNLPGLLDFVLGRAASTVRIPGEHTGVVRLAAVEAETPLEILLIE